MSAELGDISESRVTIAMRVARGVGAWVGGIELMIPREHHGPASFPRVSEPRRRAEQAIVAVVLEPDANGVSTRKVGRVTSV